MVMENVFAFQDSNNFALDKSSDANGALLIRFANLHLFNLIDVNSKTIQSYFETVLLKSKCDRIFQHQSMELLCWHAVDGRLGGGWVSIIVSIGDILPLILPVNEVQVVLALGIEFDGPICHFYNN